MAKRKSKRIVSPRFAKRKKKNKKIKPMKRPVRRQLKKPASKKKKKAKITKKEIVQSPVPDIFDGVHKTKIRVIGIGGGGGSVVSEIVSRVKKASFVAANTDLQALKKAAKGVIRFQFGQSLTHGLGTGMDSELGKLAAQQEKEKIKKLLEGQDLCILVGCLGGGTGSGASATFAKISRECGNLTYGIFTMPFNFEGEKKIQIAKNSLEKIKPYLNAFSVIPNERIFQTINKETPLREALSVINRNLAEGLEGLIEMIYDPGLINIDFADLKTIFEGNGRLAYLNTVEVSGSAKTEEAIKNLISNPLYSYTIRGAKGILFNIQGEKSLGLNDISQISKTIADLVNQDAKIIFGISQSPKHQNKIKITLLATGCGFRSNTTIPRQKKPKPRKRFLTRIKESIISVKKETAVKKKKIAPKTIKTVKRSKSKPKSEPKAKIPKRKKSSPKSKNSSPKSPSQNEKVNLPVSVEEKKETAMTIQQEAPKVRRNALDVKKEVQEMEQELLKQESQWEIPAFLRKKFVKNEEA